MEKIISISMIAMMFVSQFLAYSSLERKKRILYVISGIVPILIMSVIFFLSPRDSSLRDNFSSTFSWLLSALYCGQVLAYPLLQKRAGNLYARINDVTQKSRRWMLLFLIPILILLFLSTIPNLRAYSTGEPIYDERFFASRLPIWIIYLAIIAVILFGMLAKAELREKGVILMNQFLNWTDVESYSWYMLDEQIRLSIRSRYKFGSSSTIYLVREVEQNEIDAFLKQKGIPRQDS